MYCRNALPPYRIFNAIAQYMQIEEDFIMAGKFDNEMAADLYTLVDEDGVEQQFEMLDTMEVGDDRYYALVPYYDDPTKEIEADTELVVLKSEYDDNNEESLVSIDDDAEYERIGNMFLERLNEIYDSE